MARFGIYDHVLPISSFNLLDEEELYKAMNWMNIRPMLPLKNIKKSNKIDPWLYCNAGSQSGLLY